MRYTYRDVKLNSIIEYQEANYYIVFKCVEVCDDYKILKYILISPNVSSFLLHSGIALKFNGDSFSEYIISNIKNIF